jgi:hypothetical protein
MRSAPEFQLVTDPFSSVLMMAVSVALFTIWRHWDAVRLDSRDSDFVGMQFFDFIEPGNLARFYRHDSPNKHKRPPRRKFQGAFSSETDFQIAARISPAVKRSPLDCLISGCPQRADALRGPVDTNRRADRGVRVREPRSGLRGGSACRRYGRVLAARKPPRLSQRPLFQGGPEC